MPAHSSGGGGGCCGLVLGEEGRCCEMVPGGGRCCDLVIKLENLNDYQCVLLDNYWIV